MARPTTFDRQTSFTQFSSNYPSRQQSGTSLDAEFNAAKVALDETQANLALIQDDDGALARGSVGRAQFDSSINLGFESPSTWAADTAYTADISTVFYTSKFYIALETHTSTDTFDTTKWEEIADLSASAAIDDGSITEAKLATNSVSADKIVALAVTTPKIAAASVTNAKLAANAVTISKVDTAAGPDLASLILPAGLGPIPWASATAPTGWVLDGATYNREDYPELSAFALAEAALGNVWFTVGDGSTTFGIKSAKGLALVGVDSDGAAFGSVLALGATGGSSTRTLLTANLPAYTPSGSVSTVTGGTIPLQGSAAGAPVGTAAYFGKNDTAPSTLAITATSSSTFTGDAQGGTSTSFSIAQLSVGVRFIFKAH